ncbi:MAG: ribbon-helix-helix protein, CopG family [Leucobacter sp.]
MAMTLRIPEELDAKLERLAVARHMSKHAVILEAAEKLVSEELKTALVISEADRVMEQYAKTIRRLEDA